MTSDTWAEDAIEDACRRAEQWFRRLPSFDPRVNLHSVVGRKHPAILSEQDCVINFARFLNEAGVPWDAIHHEVSVCHPPSTPSHSRVGYGRAGIAAVVRKDLVPLFLRSRSYRRFRLLPSPITGEGVERFVVVPAPIRLCAVLHRKTPHQTSALGAPRAKSCNTSLLPTAPWTFRNTWQADGIAGPLMERHGSDPRDEAPSEEEVLRQLKDYLARSPSGEELTERTRQVIRRATVRQKR